MGPNMRVPHGLHEKLFPRLTSEEGGEEVNPVGEGDEGPLTLQSLMILGYGVDWEEESPLGQDPGSLLSGRKRGNMLGSVPERKDPGTQRPCPMTGSCGLAGISASPDHLSASPGEGRREGEFRTWQNWEIPPEKPN